VQQQFTWLKKLRRLYDTTHHARFLKMWRSDENDDLALYFSGYNTSIQGSWSALRFSELSQQDRMLQRSNKVTRAFHSS